jgi:mycothiol synthase
MLRSRQAPLKIYASPVGYSVRSLAGEKEAGDYVDLHRSVFGTKNMTVDWRLRTIRHPLYNPDLDIIVQAPDGRLVAFCICWFDVGSQDGRIEPLGCHRDFRRYALGRLAFSEGLQRLQHLGARTIHVETDMDRNTAFSLYQSFGFEVVQKALVFEKEYQPSQ